MIFTLDALIVVISFLFAVIIRFNFDYQLFINQVSALNISVLLIAYMVSMAVFRPFIGIVRYTHNRDIFIVLKVVVVSSLILSTVNVIYTFAYGQSLYPFSTIIVTALFSTSLLSGYRFIVKEFFDYAKRSVDKRTRVVIFGAGMAGRITADLLESMH